MTLIRFVHIAGSALDDSVEAANRSRAVFKPRVRRHIAGRLRRAVASGLLKPSDVIAAMSTRRRDDHGVVRLGALTQKRIRALGVHRPRLPKVLSTPYDPHFESLPMRKALAQWATCFGCRGLLTPKQLHTSLGAGGAALAEEIKRAASRYARAELQRTFAAVGRPGTRPEALLWAVEPACVALSYGDPDQMGAVVCYPDSDGSYGFTCSYLPATATNTKALLLSGVVASLRLSILSIVAPQDIGTEGFMGNSLFADVEAYLTDAVLEDGSIVLPQDLLDHVAAEHGYEIGDEEVRERLRRLLYFLSNAPTMVPRFATASAAQQALRRAAAAESHRMAAQALRAIGKLAMLMESAAHEQPKGLGVTSLDEEGWVLGLHAVCADFNGYEESSLSDLHDANMNTGAGGEFIVCAKDRFAAFALAVREACFITVLDQLLTTYFEASKA